MTQPCLPNAKPRTETEKMNQPVCIYLESDLATHAAAVARRRGATARVKVESLEAPAADSEVNLFIVEADPGDRQKVIDSIADAQTQSPALTSRLLRCPDCHSIQIEYPERPKRSPLLRGLGRLVDWVGHVGDMEPNGRFCCRKCGHLWRPEDTERPTGTGPA
jgi:hypothetical protein